MEHQVKIDVEMIRALRTGKAWSQEHLASAAGISLRTVQRVEAEGVASVGGLCAVTATYLSGVSGAEAGIAYGVIGTFLGLTGAILGLVTNRYLKPFGL